jgi:DNA-binding CsgD family transcriptional regulator
VSVHGQAGPERGAGEREHRGAGAVADIGVLVRLLLVAAADDTARLPVVRDAAGRLDAGDDALDAVELRASGETARRRDVTTVTQLTAQERQVAGLVRQGLSNRDVAAQLFLSPRTVDFHLRNVFSKLGLSSRAELAALQLG